jgi:isopenicillin N synthase-like dioxygenase
LPLEGTSSDFITEENQNGIFPSALRPMRYSKETSWSNSRAVLAQDHTDLGLLSLMFCSDVDGLEVPTDVSLSLSSFSWFFISYLRSWARILIGIASKRKLKKRRQNTSSRHISSS